jgi:Ca2+-transporting ATPase
MTSLAASKARATGLVSPIHQGVPGRVRFAVVGLYRSALLQRKLENQLCAIAGIRSVKASILTGHLLIKYAPGIELQDLVRHIEAQLGDRCGELSGEKQFRPLSFAVAKVLNGFGTWMKRLSFYPPFAAFGVAAVAAPAMPAGELIQDILPWHKMDLEEVMNKLGASEQGLSDIDASTRLQHYGPNRLSAAEKRSDLAILIDQFVSAPVGLLAASAVISVMTGGAVDAAVIMGVVLINAMIGFVTERQSEKAIASLAKSGVSEVVVVRDGDSRVVSIESLVPGDILLLTPGTYIGADIRLLRTHRLSVDESALTGESLPVSKDHTFVAQPDTALGDRVNMSYMGTHVTGGNGRGVVIATGEATELGQIQTMVGEAEAPETPMERQLDRLGTQMVYISSGVCVVVFGIGLLRGFGWLEMLKSAVSLAVAAVPEGLPAVATTTLAMGIANMRQHNVSVRHLEAVETLGSVQVFCMDKTGTLTQNRMAAVAVYGGAEEFAVIDGEFRRDGDAVDPMIREELTRLIQVFCLCSEAEISDIDGELELQGSATEKALVNLAIDAGIDVMALRRAHPIVRTRYRAEGRPFMSTLHPYTDGKHLLAVKGSPDALLAICDHQLKGGRRVRLSKSEREAILEENERMAGNALRVLGAAYRELDNDQMPSKTSQLTWLGLAGMADPMRTGMDKLIAQYHRAGIGTIMITGDQAATAEAIGEQLGLSGDKPLQVLESTKLEELDPDLLAGLARNVHVFARVSPAHKLKIVRALQEAGYVVAMTGDGINDGPALKASDIGVAMGAGGTNVAREVSDVVLEDDNLHTMNLAIRQGRTIYNNIRKMIHFMVSTNLTEIEVMLVGIAAGWGQPLNPMQLLWINLVTDIFPGLALAMEPPERDIMEREPRDPEEAIIEGRDLKRMVFESGTIGLGTMAAFWFGKRRYGAGPAAATLAFNTLTLNELAHAYSARSEYRHVFGGTKLPPNKYLLAANLGMLALQALVSAVPGARRLLGTTPLGGADLITIAACVLGPLIVNEMTKPTFNVSAASAIEMQ